MIHNVPPDGRVGGGRSNWGARLLLALATAAAGILTLVSRDNAPAPSPQPFSGQPQAFPTAVSADVLAQQRIFDIMGGLVNLALGADNKAVGAFWRQKGVKGADVDTFCADIDATLDQKFPGLTSMTLRDLLEGGQKLVVPLDPRVNEENLRSGCRKYNEAPFMGEAQPDTVPARAAGFTSRIARRPLRTTITPGNLLAQVAGGRGA